MPAIHIPEETWADLILKYGDRDAAREAVKEAAREKAGDS